MLLKTSKMWYNIIGEEYMLNELFNNKLIQVLVIFIVLDVIFGILGSIKQHKTNSTIGIDGIIRKTGMMITIIVTLILDKMCNIDLIAFIPSDLKNYLHLGKCAISLLFNSLYIIFEILSIMKNMRKCKIPLPKQLNNFLDKLLSEFTEEIKKEN